MSGQNLYYDLATILVSAGCDVRIADVNAGWERRARSSGGFPSPPLGVWWHHTASKTSPESDLAYMINGSPDAPVGNVLLDRDGVFWPIAGGACNCAGKGGPWTFSRGVCAKDSGNTSGFQIEAANNGVGERWPVRQIDAFFRGSNALNQAVVNRPDDVVTHQAYAPDRKIDPATAIAVEGPWRPVGVNSSGTWSLDDIQAECLVRAPKGRGFLMALTDQQQQDIYDRVMGSTPGPYTDVTRGLGPDGDGHRRYILDDQDGSFINSKLDDILRRVSQLEGTR